MAIKQASESVESTNPLIDEIMAYVKLEPLNVNVLRTMLEELAAKKAAPPEEVKA